MESDGISALVSLLFYCLYGIFWLLVVVISIGGLVLWVLMLIDVIQRDFKNENDKVVWILVIALTGWIGALVYYFAVKRNPQYN